MKTLRTAQIALVAWAVSATATFAEPVRTVRLSPEVQGVAAGELLPTPLSYRLERADGTPIPGLTVHVFVNICVPIGLPPPGFSCPNDDEYGGFPPTASLETTGVTDAQGIATVPGFRAGFPLPSHPQFEFELLAYVPQQVTAGGLTVSLNDAASPLNSYWDHSTVVQIAANGEGVVAVPAVGDFGLVALAVMLGVGAIVVLRRR